MLSDGNPQGRHMSLPQVELSVDEGANNLFTADPRDVKQLRTSIVYRTYGFLLTFLRDKFTTFYATSFIAKVP